MSYLNENEIVKAERESEKALVLRFCSGEVMLITAGASGRL